MHPLPAHRGILPLLEVTGRSGRNQMQKAVEDQAAGKEGRSMTWEKHEVTGKLSMSMDAVPVVVGLGDLKMVAHALHVGRATARYGSAAGRAG